MSTPTDDELLRRYAGGDGQAAVLLTRRLLPGVYHHARRMLSDDAEAEDIAQDAMMRLWRIAPEWRPGEAQVRTWLYRVTSNLCIDRLRRRPTAALEDVSEPRDERPDVEAQLVTRERETALRQALERLPERQRQAVVLRHLDGLSNPQIADIMDISARAVESLTARGKRALGALLIGRRAELGFEDDRS